MKQETDQNGISMGPNNTEQGIQNSPEFAIRQLAKQLDGSHLETAASAAEAIRKAALNSDNPQVRIEAIRALSDFASINPNKVSSRSEFEPVRLIREAQAKARDKIAAIAFGSEQTEVRLEAVKGMGRSLEVPTLEDERHDNVIQLIAIIGSTSPDVNVKNEAIGVLSRYASKRDSGGGYHGHIAYVESQNYANAAIGVVSKPTAPASPVYVNSQ